ncbi:MAG TPA: hypothetical protein VFF06_26175 [Polyangia bacterium]|nr:hypothetical protein [Polyangia bacterium]
MLFFLLASPAIGAPKKKHPPPPHKPPAWAPAPAPAPAPVAAPAPSPAPEPTPAPALAPVAAPAPAPAPEPQQPPPVEKSAKVDVDGLNAEYQSLRDELFRSRAKVELLGTALYKTKLLVRFEYGAQRAWPLKRVTLKLDDQPVFAADAPSAADPIKLYEGFAAPGKHTLTVHVDCGATGETRVAYAADGSFTLDLPDGKQSRVDLVADETGDGPQTIARKKGGVFYVRLKADVRVLELDQK